MSKSPISFRAEPGKRACPVCATDSKGCSATEDGLHLCRGEPAAPAEWRETPPRQIDDAGFRHYRRARAEPVIKATPAAAKAKPADTAEFAELSRKRVEELATLPDQLAALAAELKLPGEALAACGLGLHVFAGGHRQFTIPERDGAGAVIGLATRVYRGDEAPVKQCLKGSRRGLTLPAGWRDRPGPLFVVEGFTDAAAMTAAGLAAVGRPSNCGGAEYLAALQPDRPVIVVVENDQKDDGKWPGRVGSEAVAAKLVAAGVKSVFLAAVPDGAKDVRAWLTADDREAADWSARGQQLSLALYEAMGEATERARPAAGGERPEIIICTEEHWVNDQAAEALGRDPDVYRRGGVLVHVLPAEEGDDAGAAVRRPAGSPVIRELARPLLRERLTRCAAWMTVKGNGEDAELARAHPPDWSVLAVQARGVWPAVRHLEAVVEHPVALRDGSILAASGYHAPSRLLACLPAGLAADVPERPTQADAVAAAAALLDPLADFPFETAAHRAGVVAGILTPLAWFAFDGPAPMFLIDKNVRGAGAGLLADVISLVVTGRVFSVMAYTSDRDELRKRITTAAIEGERMVLLDNLSGPVGNDVLDAALTATRWKDRVLGSNKGFAGPLHVVWFGTGNNVQLGADTSRRVCHVRMESGEEKPELRTGFKYRDLRGHVRANRGRLLSAALTILRAHWAAGRPRHGLPAWGSYEGWSDAVREAVVFAGLADPGATRSNLQGAADRDAGAMAVVLDGIARMAAGVRGVTAADIVGRLRDCQNEEWKHEFRAAVEDLCGKLEVRPLSMKLRSFKRRNFGGRMIDTVAGHGGITRWEVVTAGSRKAEEAEETTTVQTLTGCDGCDGCDVSSPPRVGESCNASRTGAGGEGETGRNGGEPSETPPTPQASQPHAEPAADRRQRRRSAPSDRGAAL